MRLWPKSGELFRRCQKFLKQCQQQQQGVEMRVTRLVNQARVEIIKQASNPNGKRAARPALNGKRAARPALTETAVQW